MRNGNNKKLFYFYLLLSFCFCGILLFGCVKDSNNSKDVNKEKDSETTEDESNPEYDPSTDDSLQNTKRCTVDYFTLPGMDLGAGATPVSIGPNEWVGGLFVATAYVESIELCCPNWANSESKISAALYKWDTDCDITMSNEPLYTDDFPGYSDNGWIVLYTPNCEPGEYLFVLCDGEGNAGVWKAKSYNGFVRTFLDGIMVEDGEFLTRVNYRYTPKEQLKAPSYSVDYSIAVTTPPEIIYSAGHPVNTLDVYSDTWTGVDGLGRVLPTYEETGLLKTDKTREVGIFYWSWHYAHSNLAPLNVTQFMKEHPDAKNDYYHPAWPTDKSYATFWDEPLFGYYDTFDKWVLRRHAEMLADAGVDVIIFDCTNGTLTWRPGYIQIFETFAEARADGVKTPQIAFLLPFGPTDDTAVSLKQLYLDIYRRGKYQDLWYYWKGKPLIMAYSSALSRGDTIGREIMDFFTFRPGQPSYANGLTSNNRWGWLSIYPQQVYNNKDGTPEQITVGCAQNWSIESGKLGLPSAMNAENEHIFGRHYTSKGYDMSENAILHGPNLAEQFEYALEVDPEFIFITSWNEWIMGRFESWSNGKTEYKNAMVDEFDETYSRDIEPTSGFLKDHYYYQMVSYIRRYKGTRQIPEASGKKTIDLDSDTDQWNDVTPVFRAYRNNIAERDCDGYEGYHYTNKTGRNDIIESKVTHDENNIYFMVKTTDTLTQYTDKSWMRLFIDIPGSDALNWEGYEYIVNRISPTAEKAVLEVSTGGWNWDKIGDILYKVKDNVLEIAISKSLLNITGDEFTINFKWSDNMQTDGEILDFYQYGDTAPGGRFNYNYKSGRG